MGAEEKPTLGAQRLKKLIVVIGCGCSGPRKPTRPRPCCSRPCLRT